MADDNEPFTITRAELRALLREAQRDAATETDRPTPLAPSRGATGQDARILTEIVRSEIDRVRADFMRDVRDAIRDTTKDFLPNVKIKELIEETFDDVGFPIDKEHRRETAEAVRGMMKWQKRIDRVLGGMAASVVAAALYGLAKLAGINLPFPGGAAGGK